MQQGARRRLEERGAAAELALQHRIDTIRSATETAQRKIELPFHVADEGMGSRKAGQKAGQDH